VGTGTKKATKTDKYGRLLTSILLRATLILSIISGAGHGGLAAAAELTDLSLEDLMKIEITSVSRKAQRLSDAAAAVFVITQEDIRRSGVTSIPEALRMAPGVEVARIDASRWAITARGFNGQFASKLLVLMDGRTVYSPTFSGVWWDAQDTVLSDIERIEVIRGPGATLWGANAVNGVINIITKQAKDTQGVLAEGMVGTRDNSSGTVRYGGKVGQNTYFRAYGKYSHTGSFLNSDNRDARDDWEASRGGFRIDATPNADNSLTLQGDTFKNGSKQGETVFSLAPPYVVDGGQSKVRHDGSNVLGRLRHIISETSDFSLQMYFDQTHRTGGNFSEERKTVDVDFQHRFAFLTNQEVIWGLGYRNIQDSFINTFETSFQPASRKDQLFSGFLQDDIMLIRDKVHLILGSKFEHNDYTGFEMQPNVRTIWTINPRHTVWSSLSRAVRTPSRGESDARQTTAIVPPAPPFVPFPTQVLYMGDRSFKSEKLLSFELGYRYHPSEKFSLDVATYANQYDDLRTARIGTAYPVPPVGLPSYIVQPLIAENRMDGESYGVEVAAEWKALPWWRFNGYYTYAHVMLRPKAGTLNVAETTEGATPYHQASLRSSMDLPKGFEFDSWVRYVSSIPSFEVNGYYALDLRLGWKVIKNLDLSLVGQNLLKNQTTQFGSAFVIGGAADTPRTFFLKAVFRY
jgi:iron complex outermembrane recepter protein